MISFDKCSFSYRIGMYRSQKDIENLSDKPMKKQKNPEIIGQESLFNDLNEIGIKYNFALFVLYLTVDKLQEKQIDFLLIVKE